MENLLIDPEVEREEEEEEEGEEKFENEEVNLIPIEIQNDVGVSDLPIIDSASLDSNSKMPKTMCRKDEAKWMIVTDSNNNMERTENNIDYKSGRFNRGLKNELKKIKVKYREA
ncbi:hypothetical protein HZH66_012329 [Vespula vulgaris]|uniref:Uncharacterized protein n=1 Tax=Vespula vulgaris TaxID=7454 RepID=A0A834JAY6_VESVU|nr:hypothetical protein HZH66_012329 [Vespula vulgaris]